MDTASLTFYMVKHETFENEYVAFKSECDANAYLVSRAVQTETDASEWYVVPIQYGIRFDPEEIQYLLRKKIDRSPHHT
jgi:hypothetical protein